MKQCEAAGCRQQEYFQGLANDVATQQKGSPVIGKVKRHVEVPPFRKIEQYCWPDRTCPGCVIS